MTISELIERLEALKAEHGDLPVLIYDERNGWKAPEVIWDRVGDDEIDCIHVSSW